MNTRFVMIHLTMIVKWTGGWGSWFYRAPDSFFEKLRVRVLAEAAGEFSSTELTYWAGSYSVSVPPCVIIVACIRPKSFCQECR